MDEQQNNEIKKKAFSGAIWKFAERILAQVVSIVVTIVIARLLDPSDYGVVSIVTVFFAFANVIISGGLNTALIQKQNADKDDYDTVFTASMIVAVVLYVILFFAAPWIATVYEQPMLKSIIRVMGISLPIYAVKSIICAYVSSNLRFKMFFYATLGGTLASAVVGILMALNGFGAWALVAQQLTNTVIDTLILFFITKLRLSFKIVFRKLKSLLNYGYKILLSSLLGTTINQINPLFIGIKYTSADLSFYTKGKSFPETLSSSITYTLSSVLFPVLSKFQDDRQKLLSYTRTYMKVASFVVFPVMLGFFAVAENFIKIFLTDKWLPAAFYIHVACVAMMFDVIAAGNCETIKAMGRSDVFLKIEIIKKSSYCLILLGFLAFTDTPELLAISMLVCTAVQIFVNSIPNIRLLGYKIKYQLMDIIPNLVISVLMCVGCLAVNLLPISSPAILLVLQIVTGVVVYLLLNLITRNPSFRLLWNMVKKKGKKEQ